MIAKTVVMGKKRKAIPGGARRSQAEADEIDDLETRIQEFQNAAEGQNGSGPGGMTVQPGLIVYVSDPHRVSACSG